ncbi:hypothetical protein, partial [Streptomyces flaveus]|uniref:hypothetical protein n=1 Tax=Streptomyces flaveus TaxID=66370 RepID=UPI00332DDCDA
RLELRRVVLHDHEMSVLRSSRSSVSCVQDQGSRPEELLTLDMDFSVSVHRTHLVRVRKLAAAHHSAEFGLTWMSVEEAHSRVLGGEITHAPTVAGILLLAGEGRAG